MRPIETGINLGRQSLLQAYKAHLLFRRCNILMDRGKKEHMGYSHYDFVLRTSCNQHLRTKSHTAVFVMRNNINYTCISQEFYVYRSTVTKHVT
jgi:hypothetical protein